MKKLLKISLVAAFTITALTGCGSKLSTLEILPEKTIIQSNNVNGTGIVTKASFDPDNNGMHFGFDFYEIYFIDSQGINNLLSVRISKSTKLISFLHDTNTQNWEQVNQKNTKRINELVNLLQSLEINNIDYQTVVNQLIGNLKPTGISGSDDIVSIVDRNTTVLNKQKTIQRLLKDNITLENADQFDTKNVYTVEFSKGNLTINNNPLPGHLRMYLQSSGVSQIQLVGNFYKNLPVILTAKESAAILKSANNFSKYGKQLNNIFK
jgi:hypothetical protein